MPTPSARYGFILPAAGDPYRRNNDVANYLTLDNYAGDFICTSITRPSTWGAPQAGLCIWESDSNLRWRWTGSAWTRTTPTGLLTLSARTVDISVASNVPVAVVSGVAVVPAGGRSVEIKVTTPSVDSTGGVTLLSLTRGSIPIQAWKTGGVNPATTGLGTDRGATVIFTDTPPTGPQVYTMLAATSSIYNGTSVLHATLTSPIQLSVTEV